MTMDAEKPETRGIYHRVAVTFGEPQSGSAANDMKRRIGEVFGEDVSYTRPREEQDVIVFSALVGLDAMNDLAAEQAYYNVAKAEALVAAVTEVVGEGPTVEAA